MKLQISTKDHGVITSDELNINTSEISTLLHTALSEEGYLRFKVKDIPTIVPFSVLNTSVIKIIV